MRGLLAALLVSAPMAAFAQAAADGAAVPAGIMSQNGQMDFILPLGLMLVFMYFLVIRPQQKRIKEHQATLNALKKGDDVVTGGGIVGKITKIPADSDTITVEIAKGVEVNVLKTTVSGLVGGAKPVVAEKKKADKSDKNDNATVSRSSVANDN